MFLKVRQMLLAMGLFGLLDTIWFSVFMKEFAINRLGSLLEVSSGDLQVNLGAAIFVYVVMAVMAVFFLLPVLQLQPSGFRRWIYGLFFGFGVYAIFDFTNLALFPSYDFLFSVIDCLWGGLIYSAFGLLVFIVTNAEGPKKISK